MVRAREELEFIRDERGRKKAVVLPIRRYNELLEDLHDLRILAERRAEPTVSWETVKRKLSADGLLRD